MDLTNDSEETQLTPTEMAFENMPTQPGQVTEPTVRLMPSLPMIGVTEDTHGAAAAPEIPPAPAAPQTAMPASDMQGLVGRVARLEYGVDLLAHQQPQPQQEAKQIGEIPAAAPLGVAGAGILFNTNTSSLFISKDVVIAFVALLLVLVIVGGAIWAYNNTSLFKGGASASA